MSAIQSYRESLDIYHSLLADERFQAEFAAMRRLPPLTVSSRLIEIIKDPNADSVILGKALDLAAEVLHSSLSVYSIFLETVLYHIEAQEPLRTRILNRVSAFPFGEQFDYWVRVAKSINNPMDELFKNAIDRISFLIVQYKNLNRATRRKYVDVMCLAHHVFNKPPLKPIWKQIYRLWYSQTSISLLY